MKRPLFILIACLACATAPAAELGLADASAKTLSSDSKKQPSFSNAVVSARAKLIVSRNVYLALRSDDKNGNGTELDPFNCGAPSIAEQADRLDLLLTTFQPNYTFHYAAGTYYTRGWRYRKRQTAADRCKHFGAGIDKTIIKLTGASNSTEDGVVFCCDSNIRADGFELHDLTIDCDATNQPKWTSGKDRSVTGVAVHGSNITISRIKVIHFGTHSRGSECFVLSAWSYYLAGDFRNDVVEDCIISDPATGNLDGISTIIVGGAGDKGIRATQSNNVARRNKILMDNNDALYSHGPYAQLIENNFIQGCTQGVYNEPPFGGPSIVVVRNNEFVRCDFGVVGSAHEGTIVDGYRIENNTFTDCGVAVLIGGFARGTHYREIVVRGNRYQRTDTTRVPSGVIKIDCTEKAIVSQNIVDSASSQRIYIKAKTSEVSDNRTSDGVPIE